MKTRKIKKMRLSVLTISSMAVRYIKHIALRGLRWAICWKVILLTCKASPNGPKRVVIIVVIVSIGEIDAGEHR